ncbi:hypothetical protein [Sphingomonas sp. BK235]|uniref:hypothetical protein n=1 Tax=Sphingomonas sp. BK235 TaxID=2512131 RepID=UPI0010539B38|nr:hypothetical protein [Sphingomonas sp. BK235]TCP32490.1 hypothetical protein EV292_108122 [Sphingomonas sp. BK235]
MSQFSAIEIANWIAIYLAAGICCAIAMALSVTVTLQQLWKDKVWKDARTIRGAVLLLPKAWWRWQKLYLLSTPVTLGIVGSFAATMSWS